jgi:tripartite-type tricarboxylate transporter receptor subunit TctC
MAGFPDIPTISELGYKQDLFSAWAGFFAPAGIPSEVKRTLVPTIERAINRQASKEKVNKMGFSVDYKSPEE